MQSDVYAIGVRSLVSLFTTNLLMIQSGFLEYVIGSALDTSMEQMLNIGFLGHGALQQLPLRSNWSLGEAGHYKSQPANPYRLLQTASVPYTIQTNQLLPVPNGWRNVRKCNASAPPASSYSLASTPITGAEWMEDSGGNQLTAIPMIFLNENSMVLLLQANMQIPHVSAAPTLLGKG
uniref:Uncharacterized protein n=1 Tax=Solanum lycopersicum TaxID=4081 RepID=A0A3Q7GU65_SOLLC